MTSHNILSRINSLIDKPARSAVSTNRTKRGVLFAAPVCASQKVFLGFFGDFFVAKLPLKRDVLVHNNHLLFVHWCRHSVKPCALTCPFKPSNLSAWSLLSWHPTRIHLSGRLSDFFESCLLSTVTVMPGDCDYVKIAQALLWNGFGQYRDEELQDAGDELRNSWLAGVSMLVS